MYCIYSTFTYLQYAILFPPSVIVAILSLFTFLFLDGGGVFRISRGLSRIVRGRKEGDITGTYCVVLVSSSSSCWYCKYHLT